DFSFSHSGWSFDQERLLQHQRKVYCSFNLGGSDIAALFQSALHEVERQFHTDLSRAKRNKRWLRNPCSLGCCSDFHNEAVMRALELHLRHPFEHFTPKVTQEESLAAKAAALRDKVRIAEVKGCLGLKITALANKEVRALGVADEVFIPPTISGI